MLWEQEGFALADGYDPEAKRYRGLVLPTDEQQIQITDATLIVRPELATAQRAAETAEDGDPEATSGDAPIAHPVGRPDASPEVPETEPRPQKTRFFASKQLSSERYAKDFKNVADEVLAHLTSIPGAKVKISLEIEAVAPDGFDESQIRVVSENAATLKFEQSGFEDD